MSLPASVATATHTTSPSLHKLLGSLSPERRFQQPADALVIVGRQLELAVQEGQLAADISLGTLRFSLFRMHQGRIAQLAPFCRSITVYGEGDVEPPSLPGVTFVPLEPGTPLCSEWFLLVDSPGFWGALITQAVANRTGGTMRRYLFEGAVTADERLVSRASLLLSLTQRRSSPAGTARDPFANRARWAKIAYSLATHSETERLGLLGAVSDLPELLDILIDRNAPLEQLLHSVVQLLTAHAGALGAVLYRCEGQHLQPAVASGPGAPGVRLIHEGLCGAALQRGAYVMEPLANYPAEQHLLPEAYAALAVPVLVGGRPWGVLLVGQAEDLDESPTAPVVVGVATLLEQIVAARLAPVGPLQPTPPRPATSQTMHGSNGVVTTNGANNGAVAPQPAAVPVAHSAASIVAAPASPARMPALPAANTFGLPSWMQSGMLQAAIPQAAAPQATPLQPAAEPLHDRSWSTLQKRMMGSLVAFDQRGAEQVWSEACSMYATETICTELLIPVQVAVGEGWHRGEVSVAAEHFSSRFVQGKLINLLNSSMEGIGGPLAVIGCAQGEMHEIGAVMLSLFMRWSGFRVIYLGQNVPNTTIEETMRQLRPQVLGLSATTVEGAHGLTEVGHIIARLEPPRPLFIFGGMAFYERPDLRSRIQGKFLEGDIRKVVNELANQFRSA